MKRLTVKQSSGCRGNSERRDEKPAVGCINNNSDQGNRENIHIYIYIFFTKI